MTGVSTIAPIAIRRVDLPRRSFPWPAVGASISTMSALMGDALRMAYVDPYASLSRQLPAILDDGLKGRDPTW